MAFDDELRRQLSGTPVILVDIWRLMADLRKGRAPSGLKNVNSAACDLQSLPSRSVLFCTKQTVVEPNADSTYLCADGLHFTSAGNQ